MSERRQEVVARTTVHVVFSVAWGFPVAITVWGVSTPWTAVGAWIVSAFCAGSYGTMCERAGRAQGRREPRPPDRDVTSS